jgi:hypothetical protein
MPALGGVFSIQQQQAIKAHATQQQPTSAHVFIMHLLRATRVTCVMGPFTCCCVDIYLVQNIRYHTTPKRHISTPHRKRTHKHTQLVGSAARSCAPAALLVNQTWNSTHWPPYFQLPTYLFTHPPTHVACKTSAGHAPLQKAQARSSHSNCQTPNQHTVHQQVKQLLHPNAATQRRTSTTVITIVNIAPAVSHQNTTQRHRQLLRRKWQASQVRCLLLFNLRKAAPPHNRITSCRLSTK